MINLFIHPVFRSPDHKEYKKVRIYTYAMCVICMFLIPYCIYFLINYPNDTLKNWTNLFFTTLFIIGMLISRFSNNFRYATIFTAMIAYPPIMISVYNTGGIYSVDIIWFFVCLFTQCIFLDYKIGIGASFLVVVFYIYLYVTEQSLISSNNHFKEYIITHSSTHNFFSLVFVTLLIIALLSTFSRALESTNKKIEILSKEKIHDLENRLLEKTNELSEIRQTLAKDFHDEMGNKLASISLLSQSVGLKISEQIAPEEISLLLNSIEKRSKELYEGTKDFIWSIDLKSDYTDELFIYIRDFGEVFFEPLEISFDSHHDILSGVPMRLKATTGRQMVYVCKEIMTNAAKHSNCSEVSFHLKTTEDNFIISLSDNGKGFSPANTTLGGLRNIEQRIKLSGGIYEMNSNETGTHYKITLPVENHT